MNDDSIETSEDMAQPVDMAALLAKKADGGEAPTPGGDVTDAMVAAYLKAQREAVEEADRNFGRIIGALSTNTVKEACRAGLRAALAKQGQERNGNFVPGVMHCAKCKFRLNRINLNVNSGTVTAGDNKTEPCPNGCGPLWPITWEQEAREGYTALETMFERAHAAEQALAARPAASVLQLVAPKSGATQGQEGDR